MFRIKVNRAHPTGSINMRDGQNRPLTVGTVNWVEVDEISPSIEVWRKYLVIEPVGKAAKVESVVEKDTPKLRRGKRK